MNKLKMGLYRLGVLGMTLGMTLTLSGCLGGGGSSTASTSTATAQTAVPALNVVSTANPSVFPLILALSNNPSLAVTLVPVSTSNQAATALSNGSGDALLSMTYVAAQDVTNGTVPDLELVSVNFWNGFYMMTSQSANVTSFADLVSKGVLVSGPTSGGKGGGPDLIFQAAVKRAGLTVGSFDVCYAPVMQAVSLILQQQPMNTNSDCNPSSGETPSAISLVEPSSTGLIMDSTVKQTPSGPMVRAVNYQSLFTGYTAWPSSQLPNGGISVRATVLNDATRTAEVQAFISAYRTAVDQIANAKSNTTQLSQIANTISNGITKYYGQYGLSIPASVISVALLNGNLVYRTDLSVGAIQSDLNRFLTEVVGMAPPASFYQSM